ncbi:MGT4B-like protein [Mya arenaria]|uniref:MGT4B-like protein n=1 Tax=Mya arenaria TaxID=6604 RepID=A0ABY7DQY6_MYAAR|nr:MGT4B-like protein [Mya arenaria]
MGRVRARLKNVVITGIILCCFLFLWLVAVSKQDGQYAGLVEDRYIEMQERLQQAEQTSRQRLTDLQMLRSQFNFLVGLVTNNITGNNSSDMGEFSHIMREKGQNFSDELSSLHLPSIFTYLPHLTGHPESLKPVYKLSRNRFGASLVLGIPTIRREKVSYLTQTVSSLITGMTKEEQQMCLIIVFVAEPWDKAYAEEVGDSLKKDFSDSMASGLLEVISPPSEYYPDLDNLKLTFGDTKERVKWRTKQNLDFTFLMLYARTRGFYYVQLEDDVVAKPGYFSIMKTYADQQKNNDWILLEFSALGFIGKLFKSSQIPVIVEFFLMFHRDKPIDWLLDHFLSVKVCSPEKDKKHCQRMIMEVRKRFKPSLFQHVGTQSSLKGKTQKLKDRDFGKQAIYRAHVNPSALVYTNIKAYQKYLCKKAYIGEDIFWGLTPVKGDHFEIQFDVAVELESFLFRSGNEQHKEDKFMDTNVEVYVEGTPEDTYKKVGEFDADGIANGTIPPQTGKVKKLRLKVQRDLENWVVLSEV